MSNIFEIKKPAQPSASPASTAGSATPSTDKTAPPAQPDDKLPDKVAGKDVEMIKKKYPSTAQTILKYMEKTKSKPTKAPASRNGKYVEKPETPIPAPVPKPVSQVEQAKKAEATKAEEAKKPEPVPPAQPAPPAPPKPKPKPNKIVTSGKGIWIPKISPVGKSLRKK